MPDCEKKRSCCCCGSVNSPESGEAGRSGQPESPKSSESPESKPELKEDPQKPAERCSNCSVKRKVRSEKEYKSLINRLNRIEGQVRGVKSMLENDAYCIDVLTQVSAINAALNSFNKVLISNHIHSCVRENILAGNDEVIDELVVTLQKLMK